LKKIFFITTIISICISVQAQNLKYVPTPQLDKFVGTWVYNDNGKKVVIVLKKIKVDLKDISTEEMEGYHSFTIDNKPIENSIENNVPSLTRGSNFFNSDIKNLNQITILVADPAKKKSGLAKLTFPSGKSDELQWSLRDSREGMILHKPNEPRYDRTFTLPTSMILKRGN